MADIFAGLISEVLQMHPLLIAAILIILIMLAFKIFSFVMKAVFTGACFAFFPLVANLAGFSFPLTLQTILWFAVFGVIVYFGYHTVLSGYKIMRIALSPFSKLSAKKPAVKTVIIKEEKKKN
jgi:cell shape-determining protein MreD